MIGSFYSIILPGVIGGDVVRLGLSIKNRKSGKSVISISVLLERICGVIGVLIISSLAMIYTKGMSIEPSILSPLIFGITLISIFSLFIIFITIKHFSIESLLAIIKYPKLESIISSAVTALSSIPIGFLPIAIAISMIAHSFDIIGAFYLAKSLGIILPLSFFFLIVPIIYIATILPISIGGIGVREGLLVYFLVNVNVVNSDAVLLSLLIYLTRVVVGLIGGCIQFYSKRGIF